MGEPLKSRPEGGGIAALEGRKRAAFKALAEYRLWRDGKQTSTEVELWDGLRLGEAAARRESVPAHRLRATVESREQALARLRSLLGTPELRRFSPDELTTSKSTPNDGSDTP
jgi:hypothetical protein